MVTVGYCCTDKESLKRLVTVTVVFTVAVTVALNCIAFTCRSLDLYVVTTEQKEN